MGGIKILEDTLIMHTHTILLFDISWFPCEFIQCDMHSHDIVVQDQFASDHTYVSSLHFSSDHAEKMYNLSFSMP